MLILARAASAWTVATVILILGYDERSFYGRDGKRRLEPGKFKAWVGPDCRAQLQAEFRVGTVS